MKKKQKNSRKREKALDGIALVSDSVGVEENQTPTLKENAMKRQPETIPAPPDDMQARMCEGYMQMSDAEHAAFVHMSRIDALPAWYTDDCQRRFAAELARQTAPSPAETDLVSMRMEVA